jgi:hypothetical protein
MYRDSFVSSGEGFSIEGKIDLRPEYNDGRIRLQIRHEDTAENTTELSFDWDGKVDVTHEFKPEVKYAGDLGLEKNLLRATLGRQMYYLSRDILIESGLMRASETVALTGRKWEDITADQVEFKAMVKVVEDAFKKAFEKAKQLAEKGVRKFSQLQQDRRIANNLIEQDATHTHDEDYHGKISDDGEPNHPEKEENLPILMERSGATIGCSCDTCKENRTMGPAWAEEELPQRSRELEDKIRKYAGNHGEQAVQAVRGKVTSDQTGWKVLDVVNEVMAKEGKSVTEGPMSNLDNEGVNRLLRQLFGPRSKN